jgi:hypothetical protein
MTQRRFVPCNIFAQAKIEKTWEGKMAGDKWRSSLRMRIMSDEQLVTMVLEGIDKIDEYERNPELESYLTVVFTYFMLVFQENYIRISCIRDYISWNNITVLPRLKRLKNIELFYGKPEWDINDEEFTMSEVEFESWLKAAVTWLKNIHIHDSKKRKASKLEGVALAGIDVGLSANDSSRSQRHKNLWLADSGASCHLTFDETVMFDCQEIKSQIKFGNSQTMTATKLGNKRVNIVNSDGTVMEFVLEECKLIPRSVGKPFQFNQEYE